MIDAAKSDGRDVAHPQAFGHYHTGDVVRRVCLLRAYDQVLLVVLSNPSDPDHRIVWLGWGEMWRLRQKNETYLERFPRLRDPSVLSQTHPAQATAQRSSS